MFKSAILASVVVLGGSLFIASNASAGHPSYCAPHHGGYQSHRPVVISPYSASRYGYGTPYIGPDRYGAGFGYGNPGYRSYRPSIGVGVGGIGGYPYGYGSGFGGFNPYRGGSGFGGFDPYRGGSGFGGFNPYRGGSGFSLYIGR